ncbi:MAG: right-handed parallel beta-helix repeat-containing protein [Acidimicrobiales bacterium]
MSTGVLFSAAAVLVGAPTASAEACGLVVPVSMTLTGNVSGCTGTPITVTGNNVVLDLNGKTVSCVANRPGDGPGIHVPFRTNVTIRNGIVRDCDSGIYLEGGGRHTLTNLNILDNIGQPRGGGIFGEGIQLYGSHDNQILRNRVIHNGTFAGIAVYDSSRNTISDNVVDSNNVRQVDATGAPSVNQDIGIWLIWLGDFPDPGVTGNVVTRNQVTRNGLDGVQLSRFSTGNTVSSNTIAQNGTSGQRPGIRNGDGIAVFGQSSVIQSNQVTRNGGNGIFVRNNARNHQILNNQAGANGQVPPPGGPQFDLKDDNPACDNNAWRGNSGTRNQPCIL